RKEELFVNKLRKLERKLEQIEIQINDLEENIVEQNLDVFERNRIRKEIKKAKRNAKKIGDSLGVSLVQNIITPFDGLYELFDLYPENRRRSVNKIIHRGDYFNLVYSLNDQNIVFQKKDEIIFSAIPYDTARKYIQRAAILTLLYPDTTKEYLKKHKSNLMKYIEQSLRQVGKSTGLASQYYQEIFCSPLFMMQIL